MHPPLRLAVAQPAVTALDVAANAAVHAEVVRTAGARVVVFPELSLTGYELDAPALAPDDPRLDVLVEACAAAGTLALAGAPVAGAGGDHLAMLAVDGDGVRVAYRKLWLGDAEARRFVPGPAPAVVTVDGVRLGLAICKDAGVPQHVQDTAALGIDVYVAGTVKHPHEADLQDERARRAAVCLGVWVAVASQAGPTGGGYARTAGRSAIWDATGSLVARAGDAPGEVVRTTLR